MDYTRNKFVRFKDWISQKSTPERNYSLEDGLYYTRRPSTGHFWRSVREGLGDVIDSVKDFKISMKPPSPARTHLAKKNTKPKKILDPQGQFLQSWTKFIVACCVLAVFLDSLFFYIPVIDWGRSCVALDKTLVIIVCVFRSCVDLFYIIHIVFQFRTGFIDPSTLVIGSIELVQDLSIIAKRYLNSYFIIDILSVLPAPQVILLIALNLSGPIPLGTMGTLKYAVFIQCVPRLIRIYPFYIEATRTTGIFVHRAWKEAALNLGIYMLASHVILLIALNLSGPIPLGTMEALKYAVFIQCVPRLIRIYPFYKEATRTTGIFVQRAWNEAALNLGIYMLASHVVGAMWYLFSIERKERCWQNVIASTGKDSSVLYCGRNDRRVNSFLNASCALVTVDDISNSTDFNFGIFLDALQSGVVETKDFPQKFFYCFWWGLRNLSSLGQNLKTSTFVWEIIFAIAIAIFGLLLFSLLIGNIQKYFQSKTIRVEEMRVKRRDTEQWMTQNMLPEPLRDRVRRFEQYNWLVTRSVEGDGFIRSLPKDLRRDIKRYLCLDLITRVPIFKTMNEELLDAICDRLKPVLYTEKSFILREGDPVDEMLFLKRGTSVTSTTNGGRIGFFNSDKLQAGDFCGEELLTWALDPRPPPHLPTSTRTVQAVSEVEAFGLTFEDLKFVASQIRPHQRERFRHTFKFYSLQWRTWATCFIQAAWRRHCKYKHEKSLHEEEERLKDVLAKETGTTGSLSSTLYAAKFASNALKALRRNGLNSSASLQPSTVWTISIQ